MGKGFKPTWCLFAILVTVMLAQSVSAVSYFYPTQSFDCTIFEGGGQMFVSQAITLYAFEGFVDKINVTLPYGSNEILDPDSTQVRTTAAKDMEYRVIQSETQTIFEVTLPEKIYAGDDFVVILKYYIYDVAGFPKILAKDLVKNLVAQANQYEHTYCLDEKVLGVEKRSDGIIKLSTSRGEHLSKTVVVCMGMGAYIPKKLDIPNVLELEGRGVYYFVRRLNDFKDQDILIVGGGDAAGCRARAS